jgi:hypothetical protein
MVDEQDKNASLLERVAKLVGRVIEGAAQKFMGDTAFWGAARQGIDELGQAIKAFPDAIQAHAEPGGMFEPLHSDIAASREQYAKPDPPSPSQIGKESKAVETVHGIAEVSKQQSPSEIGKGNAAESSVHGRAEDTKAHTPSPSEIGKDRGAEGAEKGWRERVRDNEKGENNSSNNNDQNQRAEGRSLADEQREQRKEQEHSRGR